MSGIYTPGPSRQAQSLVTMWTHLNTMWNRRIPKLTPAQIPYPLWDIINDINNGNWDSIVCLQILKRKFYFQMKLLIQPYQSSVWRHSKQQKFHFPSNFFQETPWSFAHALCSFQVFNPTWPFYRESVTQVFPLPPTKRITVTTEPLCRVHFSSLLLSILCSNRISCCSLYVTT